MAAGRLPKPGSEYGPCEDGCKHTDCAATRAMAEAKCLLCGESIGYDARLYREEDGLTHAACTEDKIKAERLATTGKGL